MKKHETFKNLPAFNANAMVERSLKLRFSTDSDMTKVNAHLEAWNDLLAELLDALGVDGNICFSKTNRKVEMEGDGVNLVYTVRADHAGWDAFMRSTAFPLPNNSEFGLVSKEEGTVQSIVMTESKAPELRVVQ